MIFLALAKKRSGKNGKNSGKVREFFERKKMGTQFITLHKVPRKLFVDHDGVTLFRGTTNVLFTLSTWRLR